MRHWWIEAVKLLGSGLPYSECTLNEPPPIFEDKTKSLAKFDKDYNSGRLAMVVDAMNNQDIINRNILCPFGCSTNCREAGEIPLDLMIQRLLLKVNLPLFSDPSKYRLVQHTWSKYFRLGDDYRTILLNNDWQIKPSILLREDGGVAVLTCKYHGGGEDRLALYPPESPNDHIFNAEQSDQLAHFVKIPRITKPMQPKAYSTMFPMVQSRCGFDGVDTMELTTHSDFSKTSYLTSQHEGASLVGREDLSILLNQKASKGQISHELAHSYVNHAKEQYNIEELRRRAHGATYVEFGDMIRIHLFESSDEQQIRVINDKPTSRNRSNQPVLEWAKRSWSPYINILQTEDEHRYGTQFRSMPMFNTSDVPSALTWTLFAILSSSSDLWQAVDNKTTPFRWSGWEGWILTAIQQLCFQFDSVTTDKRSPFTKLSSLSKIASIVNKFVPTELDDESNNSAAAFYKLDISCFYVLFHPRDYATSLAVITSIDDAINPAHAVTFANKKIIIVVGEEPPSVGSQKIAGAEFELQVVCIVKADNRRSPSKYDAIRYMRHGRGFSSFWKQERKDYIVTQCIDGEDIFHELQDYSIDDDVYFHQCVCVYVRVDDTDIDVWRSKFFESMGGKSHVECLCCHFPLIPSNKTRTSKSKCNMQHFLRDGTQHQNPYSGCKKPESFMCSNIRCRTSVCSRCYNALPTDSLTTIIPPSDESNRNNAADDDSRDDEMEVDQDDTGREMLFEEEGGSDEGSIDSEGINDENVEAMMENFIVYTQQDTTLDLTEDNRTTNEGFCTTNAGDVPVNIEQDDRKDIISGHVIFNQVGSSLARGKVKISGTSREKHLVQMLCATSPGQASPLVQPEAGIFTRHFYISATNDRCSVLGARPLFLFSSKKNPWGFASALTQARMHMTNPNSTTSTDFSFMSFNFDILGNMALNTCDSRDVFQRGFVVDNKSISGLSVRDRGHANLSESVDSQQMVLNLAASQQYIPWTWFLTLTANQSAHPGLAFLHAWKNSKEWTKNFPNYESLSGFEKAELDRAMEHAYGVHVYNNWNAVKYLFLRYIKQQLSILRVVVAIFARDEYQADSGNLPHNHLILAIDKSTMNGDAENFIQDLIRTSVMEIVRTEDDVERLLREGLLKSIDEINDVTALAGRILPHNCNARCKRRVGTGNSEADFECRKLHSVRDCPDTTRHNYVPIRYNFQQPMLEVLEDIGMYDSNEGTFELQYFTPKRHMAPCNMNADCNMSPVIPDFFIALKSMQNAQALDHSNGLVKYVCKYLGKFDEGNYVVLCRDIHTGQWVLGKTHLHNTKIVSSKYNEDKAFAEGRQRSLPRGRELPFIEIMQLLLGHPEVYTNLDFGVICTLPFGLRPTNSIKLDTFGEVVCENPPDAFACGAPMQRLRQGKNLPKCQLMRESQVATYRNHLGKSSRYDEISIFSLRPPELLEVVTSPLAYFRFFHVDEKSMKLDAIEAALSSDLRVCRWIDCLGRQVRIRELALEELFECVEKNISILEGYPLSETGEFGLAMQKVLHDMILAYQLQGSLREHLWVKETVFDFIHKDKSELLPIPVTSNPSPRNPVQFLIHVILSLGRYRTELEALTHASFRDCLREVGLIGRDTDEDSLKRYSEELTYKYIAQQVQFYPNSLDKTASYIVMAKTVFDDAILRDELSISELPPFTMASLRAATTAQNEQFWQSTIQSQLQSIFNTLQNTEGVPSMDNVLQAERRAPLQWSPVNDVIRYEHQSQQSFDEQQIALRLGVRQIDKYRAISGRASTTYTKNVVVYGAPGAGKTFVSQLLVLYAISQGLNVISTALMGVRANALGGAGLHIHKLFHFPTDGNATTSPFRCAELALQKIKRKTVILHALLTVDVIFYDELGQISAELLSAMDIILRHLRKSQIPFAGVLMLGSMDPAQLQPINQLPFLTSSLVLTCFKMVELAHSVRAHGDEEFQRLQAITRMNPFDLASNESIKSEFFDLASRIFTYVSSWDDPKITPNMVRAFSRKIPTQEALKEYRESVKRQLQNSGVDHRIVPSRDTHRSQGSQAEYSTASEQSIKALNRSVKEPTELVLFAGGIYEITHNERSGNYSQSQLVFMLELPSEDTVARFNAINVWLPPPGTECIEYDRHNMPSRDELVARHWTEVKVGVAPERLVPVKGMHAKRLQYTLNAVGATTINKSMGATLPLGLAVEITEQYAPWEKEQVVVLTSRTPTAKLTVIVGRKDFAINKMWDLITIGNQWTRYTAHVLKVVTVNSDEEIGSNESIFNYPSVYPMRIRDIDIPTDTTGFVYSLVPLKTMDKIYIGQTECLSQRLIKHNSGNGAEGTRDIRDRPWGVAAFICGLSHMDKEGRMSLERRWKLLVDDLRRRGRDDLFSWVSAGARVVEYYNSRSEETIIFALCVSREAVNT
jgi:predicted GIY-YIG superfamily endonuclease